MVQFQFSLHSTYKSRYAANKWCRWSIRSLLKKARSLRPRNTISASVMPYSLYRLCRTTASAEDLFETFLGPLALNTIYVILLFSFYAVIKWLCKLVCLSQVPADPSVLLEGGVGGRQRVLGIGATTHHWERQSVLRRCTKGTRKILFKLSRVCETVA